MKSIVLLFGMTVIVASATMNVRLDNEYHAQVFVSKSDVGQTEVTFRVTYEGAGWVGIGVASQDGASNKMTDADMVICANQEAAGSTNLAVRRYWSTGMMKPENGRPMESVPSGAVAQCHRYANDPSGPIRTVMEFTRTLTSAAGPNPTNEILEDDQTTFIWAYGNDYELSYHKARGVVQLNVGDAVTTTSPLPHGCTGQSCCGAGTVLHEGKCIVTDEGAIAACRQARGMWAFTCEKEACDEDHAGAH